MGSFRRCIARSVPRVTFFRLLGPCAPSGECELHLLCDAWWRDSRGLVAVAATPAREEGVLVASEDAQVRRAVGRWCIVCGGRGGGGGGARRSR